MVRKCHICHLQDVDFTQSYIQAATAASHTLVEQLMHYWPDTLRHFWIPIPTFHTGKLAQADTATARLKPQNLRTGGPAAGPTLTVTHTIWASERTIWPSERTALVMSQERGTRSAGERPARWQDTHKHSRTERTNRHPFSHGRRPGAFLSHCMPPLTTYRWQENTQNWFLLLPISNGERLTGTLLRLRHRVETAERIVVVIIHTSLSIYSILCCPLCGSESDVIIRPSTKEGQLFGQDTICSLVVLTGLQTDRCSWFSAAQ